MNQTEKIMFYLFFHIFSTLNFCLRGFSSSEHENALISSALIRENFEETIFTCLRLMRILFRDLCTIILLALPASIAPDLTTN